MANAISSLIKDTDVKASTYMTFEKVLCTKIWYNVAT